MDDIMTRYGAKAFGYELRPENGNDYHGHLLFATGERSKTHRATICGALSNVAKLRRR
jgi:hypothetical protein